MKNKKLQILIFCLFSLLLFSACGEVQNYADTPYDEEKIMQMHQNKTEAFENHKKDFAWQNNEPEKESIDGSAPQESENEKTEQREQNNQDSRINQQEKNLLPEFQATDNPGTSENTEIELVQNETPVAVEKSEESTENKNICTLSVRCDTILANMNKLTREKKPLVPNDGVIYIQTELEFKTGESVFDLLKREMKKNRIHMEFTESTGYKSAYVEGINNLYEFDCGDLSGWVYKVNGKLGNVGCSQYLLKPNDIVEWVYTCDMGRDV